MSGRGWTRARRLLRAAGRQHAHQPADAEREEDHPAEHGISEPRAAASGRSGQLAGGAPVDDPGVVTGVAGADRRSRTAGRAGPDGRTRPGPRAPCVRSPGPRLAWSSRPAVPISSDRSGPSTPPSGRNGETRQAQHTSDRYTLPIPLPTRWSSSTSPIGVAGSAASIRPRLPASTSAATVPDPSGSGAARSGPRCPSGSTPVPSADGREGADDRRGEAHRLPPRHPDQAPQQVGGPPPPLPDPVQVPGPGHAQVRLQRQPAGEPDQQVLAHRVDRLTRSRRAGAWSRPCGGPRSGPGRHRRAPGAAGPRCGGSCRPRAWSESAGCRAYFEQRAGVDRQRHPGDVAGLLRAQPEDGVGDVVRLDPGDVEGCMVRRNSPASSSSGSSRSRRTSLGNTSLMIIGVYTDVGCTELTRILLGASSRARDRMKPDHAVLGRVVGGGAVEALEPRGRRGEHDGAALVLLDHAGGSPP